VADAAALLTALAGVDPDDPATLAAEGQVSPDYTSFLDANGLKGARLGIIRSPLVESIDEERRCMYDAAIAVLKAAGAELTDPATLAPLTGGHFRSSVLRYEFKAALNAYLGSLGPGAPVRSLREIIAFNSAHADTALKYGQTKLIAAEAMSGTLTEPEYILDRLRDLRETGRDGLDAALDGQRLDALVVPELRGCWVNARAGYPSIIVPAGYTSSGRPMGLMFIGRAWSEGLLIRLAYAFEQATRHRRPPELSATEAAPSDPPQEED
jgi:amidase